jgi:hypothetical protein
MLPRALWRVMLVAAVLLGGATAPVHAAAFASPAPATLPTPSPLTLDSDLRQPSGTSAWAIDAYLAKNTVLPPLGAAFMAAERTWHVNARYLVAHAMHESDFGRSWLAQNYHNLFCWTAYDRDPIPVRHQLCDVPGSDRHVAQQIGQQHLTRRRLRGAPSLRGMTPRVRPHRGARIGAIANSMDLPTLRGRGVHLSIHLTSEVRTGDAHDGHGDRRSGSGTSGRLRWPAG